MDINDLRYVVKTLDQLKIAADEFTIKGVDDNRFSCTVSSLKDADTLQFGADWDVAVVPHPRHNTPLDTKNKIRLRIIL